jgi:hypothetical protein
MQTGAIFAGPDELKELHRKIQAWRQTRPGTRPMPEELWREATSAARTLGIYRVVRALRVNSAGLKRRVMASTGRRRVGSPKAENVPQTHQPASRGDFVEISSLCGGGLGATSQAAAEGDVVVEVMATDGARLTIRLRANMPNLAGLVHAFRGRA